MSWLSTYLTYDFDQSNFNNGGEGGVNTYGTAPDQVTPGKVDGVPDHVLLRQTSLLYEAGLKADLLNKKLFVGAAVFNQKRPLPTGYAGTSHRSGQHQSAPRLSFELTTTRAASLVRHR